MSFRHDKIRGNHPITPKKGIKETDLTIRERGVNDTISVNVKPGDYFVKQSPSKDEMEKRITKERDDFIHRFANDPEMHTLQPYIKYGMYDIAILRNLPPHVVHELFGKKNYINPIYLFYGNVTQESIIEMVSKHHGTFEAQWIPKQTRRNDWRLEITGFTVKIPKSEAEELRRKLKPDEFWETKNGWRFWWD